MVRSGLRSFPRPTRLGTPHTVRPTASLPSPSANDLLEAASFLPTYATLKLDERLARLATFAEQQLADADPPEFHPETEIR